MIIGRPAASKPLLLSKGFARSSTRQLRGDMDPVQDTYELTFIHASNDMTIMYAYAVAIIHKY